MVVCLAFQRQLIIFHIITHYTRGAEIISLSRASEKRFYLHDGQGSVRELSDTDGQVTDTYIYDAFGNLLSKTGTTANDFLYTGEQYDANTGFYYLRARYMNPSTGTFTSMDANAGTIFDPVSLHKYLYANANPVMNRDPSGYFTLTLENVGVAVRAVMMKVHEVYNSVVKVVGSSLISNIIVLSVLFVPIMLLMSIILDGVLDDMVDTWLDGLDDFIREFIIQGVVAVPISGAVAIPIAETTDDGDGDKGPYTVYALVDKKIRINQFPYFHVVYVGRAMNIVATRNRHKANPARRDYILVTLKTNLSYNAARGLEQSYIVLFATLNNGNSTNNQINGVSPTNPNIGTYEAAATLVLGDESETYVGGVFYE